MVPLSQKQFGSLLIGVSILLLILLSWVKANIDAEEVFLCEAVAANPSLSMEDCPAHTSNTSWLLVGAFSLTALIFGSGMYLALFSGRGAAFSGAAPPKPADLSKLDEAERKIYAALQERQGSMYQSDLIKETGMSKVQMTRVLDRMVGKQVVDRQRRGMTNIVVLR